MLTKHSPASNTAAVVTLAAAGTTQARIVEQIVWSYDGNPTGGNITITNDGTAIFDIDITAGGPGSITFPGDVLKSTANKALVITLAAGGSGISGNINVFHKLG